MATPEQNELYGMTSNGEVMLSTVPMTLDVALKDGVRRGWLRSDGLRVWATRHPEASVVQPCNHDWDQWEDDVAGVIRKCQKCEHVGFRPEG
jgi:hypothetical protein